MSGTDSNSPSDSPPDGLGKGDDAHRSLSAAVRAWLGGGLGGAPRALRDAVKSVLKSATKSLPPRELAARLRLVRAMAETFRVETSSLREEIAWVDRLLEKSEARCADSELQRLLEEVDRLRLKRLIHEMKDPALERAMKEAAARRLEETIVDAVESGKVSRRRPLERSLGYGRGLSERSVEIPLAVEFARLREPGRLLDAGSSLNLPCVRRLVPDPTARVVHLTLCGDAESPLFCGDRMSYLFGDLRALDFRDGVFDRIACVSTIEHIGMDNSRYGGAKENAPASSVDALCEMLRVLRPGGELLLTFPCGLPSDHGWFRILGEEDVDRLRRAAAPHRFERRRYLYDRGWFEASEGEPVPEPPSSDSEAVMGLGVVVIAKAGIRGSRST